MITCLKHNVEFIDGKCPKCAKINSLTDTIKILNNATEKLKSINIKIEALLKENKCKKK